MYIHVYIHTHTHTPLPTPPFPRTLTHKHAHTHIHTHLQSQSQSRTLTHTHNTHIWWAGVDKNHFPDGSVVTTNLGPHMAAHRSHSEGKHEWFTTTVNALNTTSAVTRAKRMHCLDATHCNTLQHVTYLQHTGVSHSRQMHARPNIQMRMGRAGDCGEVRKVFGKGQQKTGEEEGGDGSSRNGHTYRSAEECVKLMALLSSEIWATLWVATRDTFASIYRYVYVHETWYVDAPTPKIFEDMCVNVYMYIYLHTYEYVYIYMHIYTCTYI